MIYNVFKVKDKQNLLNDLDYRGFEKVKGTKISGEYSLSLYYKYDEDQMVNWKNIFYDFGEDNVPKKTGLSGIIICEGKTANYAITYGSSSFVVQKNSEKEFGFDFAKRIELEEIKRKSSRTPYSNKNSAIMSFKNTKTIMFETGEDVTSLSFKPLNSFYGKRVDVGKSIKFNVKFSLDDLHMLLDSIELDLQKPIINRIPLLSKVTNPDEILQYNETMYNNLRDGFRSYISNSLIPFSVNEFTVIGSGFYFEENYNKVVKIGRCEFDLELHDLNDLFSLAKEANIDIQSIIEAGKIIYYDSNSKDKVFSEPIKKLISYEIDSENVSLYEGEWYYYNTDYYDLIMDEIDSIEVKYDSTADLSYEILKDGKIEGKYREDKINRYLTKKFDGKLLDRDLFISKYENEYFESKYKVEVADLLINGEYISVKVGSSSSLSYCIDQSELAARLIQVKKVNLQEKNLPIPSKYGVWFYLESDSVFQNGRCDIKRIGSIMLLSKLCDWSKSIKTYGKQPVIHVNKYEK